MNKFDTGETYDYSIILCVVKEGENDWNYEWESVI